MTPTPPTKNVCSMRRWLFITPQWFQTQRHENDSSPSIYIFPELIIHPFATHCCEEAPGGEEGREEKPILPPTTVFDSPYFQTGWGDDWLGLGWGMGGAAKDASLYISTERTRWLVTGGREERRRRVCMGFDNIFTPANFQGSVHYFLGVEIIQCKVSCFIYCMVNATPHALPSPPHRRHSMSSMVSLPLSLFSLVSFCF